jgi:hypothetical protein
VSLTNPELTLGTGTEGSALSFELSGGPEVKLFDIDTSQLEGDATPNGTLDLNGLLATVSSEGASTLNTILGQNVFTTGEPVGGISLILPAAAVDARAPPSDGAVSQTTPVGRHTNDEFLPERAS